MSLKSKLNLIGGYLFRWVGFSVEPTLIKIGKPTSNSPVLLTCNFNLTVKRVLKKIKNLDCYLLIAPSKGINVWCGACGDDFNSNSVISIIKTSGINELVSHRTLILPQLSATGIDPVLIKEKTGWNAKFGPVYAKDIPDYLKNNQIKTKDQREVRFSLLNRVDIGNIYFFMLFVLFSIIYGIISIFIPYIGIFLYFNSVLILIGIVYGTLILLPSISWKKGKLKLWIFEIFVVLLIIIFNFTISLNLFYLLWEILISFLFIILMAEDFHGLTPTYKSEMGEKAWNKGKTKMKFLFAEYKLNPYGTISIDRDQCVGCKMCVIVCPRYVYSFNEKDKKADLINPQNCINCNACVNRCIAYCLKIA